VARLDKFGVCDDYRVGVGASLAVVDALHGVRGLFGDDAAPSEARGGVDERLVDERVVEKQRVLLPLIIRQRWVPGHYPLLHPDWR